MKLVRPVRPCSTYTALSAHLQLPSEDPEVSEVSSKCLSILVQLYGGDSPDSLSPENLETFANLLVTKEDPKDQKLLLRILRRMVSRLVVASRSPPVQLSVADIDHCLCVLHCFWTM